MPVATTINHPKLIAHLMLSDQSPPANTMVTSVKLLLTHLNASMMGDNIAATFEQKRTSLQVKSTLEHCIAIN